MGRELGCRLSSQQQFTRTLWQDILAVVYRYVIRQSIRERQQLTQHAHQDFKEVRVKCTNFCHVIPTENCIESHWATLCVKKQLEITIPRKQIVRLIKAKPNPKLTATHTGKNKISTLQNSYCNTARVAS